MIVQEINPIPEINLPVDDLRSHLRMGTGFDEDTLQDKILSGFLRAALTAIESRTNKVLIARSFRMQLTEWQPDKAQTFPLAPVSQIISVQLLDANDVSSTLSPAVYRLKQDTTRPSLVPASATLPSVGSGGSVQIDFVAGYGGWTDVPPDLRQAVMMLTAHFYENRNETHLGQGCMPFGVTALIERYKVLRVGFGDAS